MFLHSAKTINNVILARVKHVDVDGGLDADGLPTLSK